MSSLMGSHGVALATAMAVSATVILVAVCRQKPLSTAADRNSTSPRTNLRSCISSDEGRRERGGKNKNKNKKKRVRFAEDVVVEFDREISGEEDLGLAPGFVGAHGAAADDGGGMPANRAALYHGIVRDRLRRVACSY